MFWVMRLNFISLLGMIHLSYRPIMNGLSILFRDSYFLFSCLCRVQLFLVGLLLRFLIIPRLWRRCIVRPEGAVIKGHITRTVLVRARVDDSGVVDHSIGNLHASLINIRVSLVSLSMLNFRLSIGVCPTIVIILARVVVNLH